MRLQAALNWVEQSLVEQSDNKAGLSLDDARVDARFLLSHLLDKSFTWIKTWPEHELSQAQFESLKSLTQRRKQGEPIAYILGKKDFWNLSLKCSPASLIPRAETELLVELALEYLQDYPKARILDLGTGTGAIGLAIANSLKSSEVTGVDFSADAVALCEENKQLNQVGNFQVLQSDWFSALDSQSFQLIVANPPYVAEGDPHLMQGDLPYEPDSALVAADNGLAEIKRIILESQAHLDAEGCLMIEHGYDQAELIQTLFQQQGYQKVASHQDIAGIDRVTLGYKSD